MKISELRTGTPATIQYWTDTRAAVVERVTARRVWICRVETTNERPERETAEGEYPVIIKDGVLNKPVGKSEMFTLYVDRDGDAYATKGDKSTMVRFGRSVTRVDYKF